MSDDDSDKRDPVEEEEEEDSDTASPQDDDEEEETPPSGADATEADESAKKAPKRKEPETSTSQTASNILPDWMKNARSRRQPNAESTSLQPNAESTSLQPNAESTSRQPEADPMANVGSLMARLETRVLAELQSEMERISAATAVAPVANPAPVPEALQPPPARPVDALAGDRFFWPRKMIRAHRKTCAVCSTGRAVGGPLLRPMWVSVERQAGDFALSLKGLGSEASSWLWDQMPMDGSTTIGNDGDAMSELKRVLFSPSQRWDDRTLDRVAAVIATSRPSPVRLLKRVVLVNDDLSSDGERKKPSDREIKDLLEDGDGAEADYTSFHENMHEGDEVAPVPADEGDVKRPETPDASYTSLTQETRIPVAASKAFIRSGIKQAESRSRVDVDLVYKSGRVLPCQSKLCMRRDCCRHYSEGDRVKYELRMSTAEGMDIDVNVDMDGRTWARLVSRYEGPDFDKIILSRSQWVKVHVRIAQYWYKFLPLQDTNLTLSSSPEFLNALRDNFGVDHECNASPHEAHLSTFNSPFWDITSRFGSSGPFLSFCPLEGAFQCNPVWTEAVLAEQIVHIVSLIRRADWNGRRMSFFMLWPSWTDSLAFEHLLKNGDLVSTLLLLEEGARFVSSDMRQSRRPVPNRKPLRFIVMASRAVRESWDRDRTRYNKRILDVLSTIRLSPQEHRSEQQPQQQQPQQQQPQQRQPQQQQQLVPMEIVAPVQVRSRAGPLTDAERQRMFAGTLFAVATGKS